MKLYEINKEIENLFASAIDPETGEITKDAETLATELEKLNGDKKDILVWLAKSALNTQSDISAIKIEKARLTDELKKRQKEYDRKIAVLDRECGGKKTDLEVATPNYRKTQSVEITNNEAAVEWLENNGYDDAVKYGEPEVRKMTVKEMIKAGAEIPGIQITARQSVTLK